tara:strand:+ start:1436 stop:2662 length:1227 start_codon:yes stop_codon:yes gene_type:complete
MAKLTKPLSSTEVLHAKPRDKEYNLADGRGLLLRIKPNGSKSWLLNYQKPFIKTRSNLSLGSYPEISLAEARKRRDEARELLAQDIDPKTAREALKRHKLNAQQSTFQSTAKKWFEVKRETLTPDYRDDIWRSLENHIFPRLGNVALEDIRAPQVIEVLEVLAAKGKLEAVKRLCQKLNEIMTFAVNTGKIHANPLSGIKSAFKNPPKRHYPTLKPEQLSSLVKDINKASIQICTRNLMLWQLHTLARPSEAAGTRWEEIDLVTGLWTLPKERMKKRREHIVPLTSATRFILSQMSALCGQSEFVFPSPHNNRRHTSEQTANMALKRMGYKGRLVAHGFRALGSTTLNEKGFDPDLIESALAHVDKNAVRSAYNRAKYLEQRREMMNWWSEEIQPTQIDSPTLKLVSA